MISHETFDLIGDIAMTLTPIWLVCLWEIHKRREAALTKEYRQGFEDGRAVGLSQRHVEGIWLPVEPAEFRRIKEAGKTKR